jgi:hypothetical protein
VLWNAIVLILPDPDPTFHFEIFDADPDLDFLHMLENQKIFTFIHSSASYINFFAMIIRAIIFSILDIVLECFGKQFAFG